MQYKKNFWEKFFLYPAFNYRFWTLIISLILLSILFIGIVIKYFKFENINETLSFINIVVQADIFLLGVITAYYAFSQILENRLDKIKQIAFEYLKNKDYEKAIDAFKEAIYIKLNFDSFADLLELFLITKSYSEFDETIQNFDKAKLLSKIISNDREKIIFLYLQTTRYLLTENIGNAKHYLGKLINLVTQKNLTLERGFLIWNFSDLQQSEAYTNLKGESKKILDNLIRYLTDSMNFEERKSFEEGNYSLTN